MPGPALPASLPEGLALADAAPPAGGAPAPPGQLTGLPVALAGLLLVLFLVVHLALLSLAPLRPDAFEALAAGLHRRPWLPPLELGLAALFLIHPLAALGRQLANRRARGPAAAPLRSRRGPGLEGLAALAARWLPWSGALLLLFLPLHLAQLRWHRPSPGAELLALRTVLAAPPMLLLYSLAGLAVGLHLFHGLESAHRSLGWLDSANSARIRALGRVLALLLGGGFALLPLALLLGSATP